MSRFQEWRVGTEDREAHAEACIQTSRLLISQHDYSVMIRAKMVGISIDAFQCKRCSRGTAGEWATVVLPKWSARRAGAPGLRGFRVGPFLLLLYLLRAATRCAAYR